MSSVFEPSEALFSLLRTLTVTGLDQRADAATPMTIGAYRYTEAAGGFVLKLFLSAHRDPFEVGYLPKEPREKRGTIAKFVAATERQARLFKPVSADTARSYLETLAWAIDQDRAGIVDIKVPVSNLDEALPTLERAVLNANTRQAAEDPSTLPHVSFQALARDVLSGFPEPFRLEEPSRHSYEVWGSRTDERAAFVVRYFDGGSALAVAAYVPETMDRQLDFDEAVYLLIESLLNPTAEGPPAAVFAALKYLEGTDGHTCLRRALNSCDQGEGMTYEPGLTGEPSTATLSHLKSLRALDPQADGQGAEVTLEEFERIARLRLLAKAQYTWSAARERDDLPRIEVLEHPKFVGSLVLVQIEPRLEAVYLSAFYAGAEGPDRDAFLAEVHQMGHQRAFGSRRPLPLSTTSAFTQVSRASADSLLRPFAECATERSGFQDFDSDDFTTAEVAKTGVQSANVASELFAATGRAPGVILH